MKYHCTACGADSQTDDFCDQCGARLNANAAAPAVAAANAFGGQPRSPAVNASPGQTGETCPTCDEPRVDDGQYCEACGYDFVNKSMPQAPMPQPAAPVVPAPGGNSNAASSSQAKAGAGVDPQGSASASTESWWAIVTSDQEWYKRSGFEAEGIAFPDDYLPRQFPLDEPQVRIGRNPGGGIDLGSAPKDKALSGEHATLLRQNDGSYHLVDYKSSNGTFVNGTADPIAKGVEIPLSDGDYVCVGAWTRITFQKR